MALEGEYDALLYSLVHTGNPGDLTFYLDRTEEKQRVLELGVGYGRVMNALARAGRCVTGVELHPGLLALAQSQKAALPEALQTHIRLLLGDMTALDEILPSEPSFEVVIIPYSGLWCLLDDDSVRACLRGARRRLRRDGRLLLDAYACDEMHAACTPDDQSDMQLDEVCTVVAGEHIYDVYERSRWDKDRQRLLATYVYAAMDGSEQRSYCIDGRYLLRGQLESLLMESGFAIERVSGDFNGTPYTDESELIVVEARAR